MSFDLYLDGIDCLIGPIKHLSLSLSKPHLFYALSIFHPHFTTHIPHFTTHILLNLVSLCWNSILSSVLKFKYIPTQRWLNHQDTIKVTSPEAQPGQLKLGAHRRHKGQDYRCAPKADRSTQQKIQLPAPSAMWKRKEKKRKGCSFF